MGTWSHEPFGNDTAGDWAYGLLESQDLSYIEAALDKVLQQSEYLEAPDAEEAIAAIEVVAKLRGKGTQTDAYTEEVDDWVASMKQKPGAALLQKTQRTLKRVVSGESELLELWSEGAELGRWKSSVAALELAIT